MSNQMTPLSLFKTESNTGRVFFDGKLIPEEQITRIGPDSFYIENFMHNYFPAHLQPDLVFETIKSSDQWVPRSNPEILYRGNELNRGKMFATENTEVDPPTGIPLLISKYTYSGSQWLNLLNYKTFKDAGVDPIVQELDKISFTLPTDLPDSNAKMTSINNVIITAYETPEDGISLHHDREDDIAKDSLIISLSLGDVLEMKIERDSDSSSETFLQKSGSLFAIGPQTNRDYRHGIIPAENETIGTKKLRAAPFGCRISIIGRHISTVVSQMKVIQECKKSLKTAMNRICGKSLHALSKAITAEVKDAGITEKTEIATKRKELKSDVYSTEWKRALREREQNKIDFFTSVSDSLKKNQTTFTDLISVVNMFHQCKNQFYEENERQNKRAKLNSE